MKTNRGKFITIEGQDGAGKSTNLAVIERWLVQHNISYVLSREPGGTRFGEKIRDIILNSKGDNFCDKSELLLVFAARAQHIKEVIEPALAAKQWVLCDRFTDATYAYQGGGRGIDWQEISPLESYVQGSLRPDITILLDLPVELGQSRTNNRDHGVAPDRFEQQKIEFKQRVRDAYLELVKREPSRLKTVDASAPLEQVEQKIIEHLNNFLQTQATSRTV